MGNKMNQNGFQSKRYRWMVDLIQDSFEITSKNFNVDLVLRSERFIDKIEDFLHGKGPCKLIFYFQSNEDMNSDDNRETLRDLNFPLTTGEDEGLNNKGIYFLRTTPDGKNVNLNDLNGDVLFGEIVPNSLNQLNMMMSCVFQPLIEKLDNDYWCDCDEDQKKEFLQLNYNFTNDLDESINSLSNNLDKCKIDQSIVNSYQNELDRNSYFETLFEGWLKEF